MFSPCSPPPSAFAPALEPKALKVLWDTVLGRGEGRRALVAAAVAILKWAEDELLEVETEEEATEVLCTYYE